jgi:hypothetical protein
MKLPAGSRFLYLTGCDGTGKTTQADWLCSYLKQNGIQPRRVWLRFPFLFSVPLLAYAKWRRLSWHETVDGVRHGYWDFRASSLLKRLLPWTLLLDATLAALIHIYLPLWRGETVVCERFVLDMLVDLMVAFDEPDLHSRRPGSLYRRLLPNDAMIGVLDLDALTIRARRADLRSDRRLEFRLSLFRQLAAAFSLPLISSAASASEVNRNIVHQFGVVTEELPKAANFSILSASRETVDSKKKSLGYGKLKPSLWRWLLRNPLLAMASHWTFQSLLYMDTTERWFKIGLDVILTVVIGAGLSLWLTWPLAGLIAFLLAHTLNFLFNGHLWGALKHYGLVTMPPEVFECNLRSILKRAQTEPAIRRVLVGGGVARGNWTPASDIDVRFIRHPGVWNGLRACWFTLSERTRALFSGVALDAYVLDSEVALAGAGFSRKHDRHVNQITDEKIQ